jgi:hypothetical protein
VKPVPILHGSRPGKRRRRARAGSFETGGDDKMKQATSRELYDYWDRVRRGRPAPRRSDIEPSDIRRILADTFILEVAGREDYTIRLAGTRICNLYGREMKAGNFLDLWSPEDRNAMSTLGTAVGEDAAGAVVTFTARTASGHSLTAELLMLPLSHSGERYDRVLGSISPLERPYWVGSEALICQGVVSLRLLWPNERPHFMRRAADRAETGVVIPVSFERRRRHGHLFVLDGGKD